MRPCRFIAKQAVIAFVAMVVQRFDVVAVGQQEFPRLEEGNPVRGIMSRGDGDDLSVKLTQRRRGFSINRLLCVGAEGSFLIS